MSSRLVYAVALWRQKTPICAFFGLWHLVVSPIGSNLRKLNTVHNYKPYDIQWYQNRFFVLQHLHGQISSSEKSEEGDRLVGWSIGVDNSQQTVTCVTR